MKVINWFRRKRRPTVAWPVTEEGDVPFFIINGHAYRIEPGSLVWVNPGEQAVDSEPVGIRYHNNGRRP